MKNIFKATRKRWLSKFIRRKKPCEGMILTMIIVFVLITFSTVIGEFYRIHILQQDIEYQLQRSVNCAVEYAMGDSFRQDKIVNLDVALAKSEFYKYIGSAVGLDSENKKYKNGKVIYKLNFSSVSGTSNPAVFTVKGTAEASSLFSFLVEKVEIPFQVSSTNYRLD
jgi:hypothetical protein